MARQDIPFEELVMGPVHLWAKQWMVLAAGDFAAGRFNAMTVGWGSVGVMWGMPFSQVVVRPSRYTREFMESCDTFTLNAFPQAYRKSVLLLGQKSGRDADKISEAGLTATASTQVASPSFAEAELVIECRKLYWQDMDPTHFIDSEIEKNYPKKDYHRIYFGGIVAISGEGRFRSAK